MAKRFFGAFGAVLAMSIVMVGQTHPDLSGTWTFDETRSTGITDGNGRMIASTTIVISQTPVEIRIERAALLQSTRLSVYALDGGENTTTDANGTTRSRAAWDGDTLVVTSRRTYPGPQGPISLDTKEVYSLKDGVLTIEETHTQEGRSRENTFTYTKGPARVPESPRPRTTKAGPIPRTPDGKPDLQGYWTGNSLGGIFDLEPHPTSFAVGGGPGIVVDPPDKMIPYQPWARKEKERRAIEGITLLQDPEPHCFLSGVPRQMYVMPYQIFQTPTTVVMLYEYVHARRIIDLTKKTHLPNGLRLWEGDSIAHWEGDTLVVDNANFNGKSWLDMAGNFFSEHAHVVERLTMVDPNTIRYRATIEDATVFTRPWTIEMDLPRSQEKGYEIFESACHEEDQDLAHVKAATESNLQR